jgi:hypothetical protein
LKPISLFVIARSEATRQSSDRLGIPHVFALSLQERRDAANQPNHPANQPNHPATHRIAPASLLSLRGAQRRGNPAEPWGNPPHRPGIPHNDPDWIATP